MKNWYLIPLAALVGLMAGSWGPRADLSTLREDLEREFEVRLAKEKKSAPGLDALSTFMKFPEAVQKPQSMWMSTEGGISEDELLEGLSKASDLWMARVEIAKVQWKRKLGFNSRESEQRFDMACATMNQSMKDTFMALAQEIERTGEMSHELGIRVIGDVTRAMAETYDLLAEADTGVSRAEISKMPIFEFIDPMVAEPLIGVQDKIRSFNP